MYHPLTLQFSFDFWKIALFRYLKCWYLHLIFVIIKMVNRTMLWSNPRTHKADYNYHMQKMFSNTEHTSLLAVWFLHFYCTTTQHRQDPFWLYHYHQEQNNWKCPSIWTHNTWHNQFPPSIVCLKWPNTIKSLMQELKKKKSIYMGFVYLGHMHLTLKHLHPSSVNHSTAYHDNSIQTKILCTAYIAPLKILHIKKLLHCNKYLAFFFKKILYHKYLWY